MLYNFLNDVVAINGVSIFKDKTNENYIVSINFRNLNYEKNYKKLEYNSFDVAYKDFIILSDMVESDYNIK